MKVNSPLLNLALTSCQLHADKIFFKDGSTDEQVDYKTFYQDALHLACWLEKKQKSADVVILLGTNCYHYTVALIGTLLSGKTLFLLNPNEDQQILNTLMAEIDKKKFIINFEQNMVQAILNEKVDPFSLAGPKTDQDLIYIPTSATTGISKIVIQKEKDILENIQSLIQHHNLAAVPKNIGTPLPLFHVNALHFSFFCTLLTGGTLTLYSHFDLKKMVESVNTHQLHILSLIPTLLNGLLRRSELVNPENFQKLSYFVSAAAPLSRLTAEEIIKMTGKKIIQGYGLSEGVNFTCKIPVTITDEDYDFVMFREKVPGIGPALPGCEISVRNAEGTELQAGVEGEFFIKGPNFCNGYLNQRPDESSPTPSDHYFASGDLGYYQFINGRKFFFITGRKKEMAKINGESVSLRQVEELIAAKEHFQADFIVTAFNNSYRGEELGLVLDSRGLTNEGLQLEIKKFKSALMTISSNRRPKVLMILSASLRTPSGKARRWFFKHLFAEYEQQRLLNSLVIKITE